MIAIIIILSLISLSCLSLSIFLFIYSRRLARWVYNIQKSINQLNQEIIPTIRNEIVELQKNPADFTKRFSLVDFKISNLTKAIENFNNGFAYRTSTM